MKTETQDLFADLEPQSQLICRKCGHPNPGQAEKCENCHRHLLVFCAHCGHANYRGMPRCVACRTQLHLAWPHRWKDARARRWVKPVEIALWVAAVLLTAEGVIRIAEIDFPKREPAPPQVYVLNPDGTWRVK